MQEPLTAEVLSEWLDKVKIRTPVVALRPDGRLVPVVEVRVSLEQVTLVLMDTGEL